MPSPLPTDQAYPGLREPPEPKQSARKPVPKAAVLAVGGRPCSRSSPARVRAGRAEHPAAKPGASTSASGPARRRHGRVAPPADVTAVAVSRTAVRLSWRNAGPQPRTRTSSSSMGDGYKTRACVLNQSPQVITGLNPAQGLLLRRRLTSVGRWRLLDMSPAQPASAAACPNPPGEARPAAGAGRDEERGAAAPGCPPPQRLAAARGR